MPGFELLKWFALLLMTGDHVNVGLLDRSVPWLYDLGRVVMPVFAAILAFNLSGRGNVENGRYLRVLKRLVIFGLLAYPFHVLVLGQGWAVGNILLGYALAVACMWLLDRITDWPIAPVTLLVLVGGLFVEFFWAAPLVTLAWWAWWRHRSVAAASFLGVSLVLLCWVNGNLWALGCLPLVWLGYRSAWAIPRRWPMAFYWYYPAHLAVLAVIQVMGN